MLAGFHGQTVPVELRSLAREFDLGGVILVGRNVAEPAQVADLARQVQELSRTAPPWVAIEQEGGPAQCLQAPLTTWPAFATLGRADDLGLTRSFGRALARELRAMGITYNLAPVLDVRTRARDAAIGDRALSDEPAVVARHGVAFIEALRQEGLPACAKHFPGHGDAPADSRDATPVIDLPPDRFEHVEWVPFKAAIDARVDAVMACHVVVPSLDEQHPATLSREVITSRLRGQLAHGGVVFTDDMDLPSISTHLGPAEAAIAALAAGCDGILHGGGDVGRVFAALEGIVRALEDESLRGTRVDEALKRQFALKTRYLSSDAQRLAPGRPTLREVIGSAEHAAVAERMRQFA